MFAMLWVHYPGKEPISLDSRMFFMDGECTVQVVGDVVISQCRARQARRFARTAPVQFADLEDAMVSAIGVVSGGVEARLVESDADPCGDVVRAHTECAQLARQLAPIEYARAGDRQKRTRQPRDAIHRSVRLTDLRPRTHFYVSTTDLPPRGALELCRARIPTAISIVST